MVEERYEIRGKIGQGGVGVVYKAYDTQLRREVAIKRVLADELEGDSETATKNLLKEATALSSVQHPHICTVYDAGLDDDGPFVVMELINGKTLDEMVERGSLTYEDFREVAIQSQEAMIAAQELNLVHRDLKPSNVMVSWLPSGRFQIKLVDFGLAKFSAKPSLQTIDHGDAVFGSIFFMAPEQFERTPLDQRTDMYSLGAMFYYALSGNYPFDGETAPQVMASHLQNSVIPLQQVRPDLPIWLCEWVMWHIQRDMDHRPASAQLALQKFLADESDIAQAGMQQSPQQATSNIPTIRKLNTGIQAVQPAGNITGPLGVQPQGTGAVQTITAPQPILSPDGRPSPSTSPVAIQPSYGMGGTAPVDATGEIPAESATVPVMATPAKKPMSKSTFIILASMLSIALIIVCIIIFGASKEKNLQDEYSTLIKDIEAKNTLTVTEDQLDVLLTGMVKPDIKDKIGGYTAMSKAVAKDSSFSPTLQIAKFVTVPGQNIKDESMRQLFKAIYINPGHDPETDKVLLEYAIENPDKQQTAEAINRMKSVADDSYIDDILTIYEKSEATTTRQNCSNTLIEIIKRSGNKKGIADKLISKYNGAWDEDQKLAYLRLLGTTGTKEALDILYKALKNEEITFRMSASKALSTSPSIEAFEPMLEVYSKEPNEFHLIKYRKDIFSLLKTNENAPDTKKAECWMKLYRASPTDKSKKHVISELSSIESDFAGKLLKQIAALPSLSTDLKAYANERIKRRE